MSCNDGHLRFPTEKKNQTQKFYSEHSYQITIPSHERKTFLKLPQIREHIGASSHVGFPNERKIKQNVEDYPRNISTKFGSQWTGGL